MNIYHPNYQLPFRCGYNTRKPFPEGTHGFLYYNSPPAGVSPAAGELRFRLTPGDDPASFDQGSDLQVDTGLPWCIPLLKIVATSQKNQSQQFQPIQKLLRDDGFVTPALLETCTAMLNANNHYPNGRIIHSFGQLFHIGFDQVKFGFYTLSMNQLQSINCGGFYHDRMKQISPYSGGYTMIH